MIPAALVFVSAVSNTWPTPVDRIHRVNASLIGANTIVPAVTAFANPDRVDTCVTDHLRPPTSARRLFSSGALFPLHFRRQSSAHERPPDRRSQRSCRGDGPLLMAASPHQTEIVHGTADSIVSLADPFRAIEPADSRTGHSDKTARDRPYAPPQRARRLSSRRLTGQLTRAGLR